jgi:hypothetical protein
MRYLNTFRTIERTEIGQPGNKILLSLTNKGKGAEKLVYFSNFIGRYTTRALYSWHNRKDLKKHQMLNRKCRSLVKTYPPLNLHVKSG